MAPTIELIRVAKMAGEDTNIGATALIVALIALCIGTAQLTQAIFSTAVVIEDVNRQ